jgi:TolB protein
MKPNGSDRRKLTGGTSPEYSANGREIVFAAHRDGDFEIYTIRTNRTHRRQLTDNSVNDIDPAFSPSGRQIVFSRSLPGGHEIFKMRSDGTHKHQLTHDTRGNGVVGATFSPSGRQIVYVQRDFRPYPDSYGVFHMRADGTHRRFVAVGKEPDYFPYGGHIVADRTVIGDIEDAEDLFKVEPNGSHHVWLTRTPQVLDIDPAFSPNGRWVVWSQDGAVYKMRSNGTRIRRLTRGYPYGWLPDWQPRPR